MKIHPLTPRAAILVTGCALLAAGLTAQDTPPVPAAPEALPRLPAPTAPSALPQPPTPLTPSLPPPPVKEIPAPASDLVPVKPAPATDVETLKRGIEATQALRAKPVPATPPSDRGDLTAPVSDLPGPEEGAAPGSPSPAGRARALHGVDESWDGPSGGGSEFGGGVTGRAGGIGVPKVLPGRPSSVRPGRAVLDVALDAEVLANPQDATHRYEAIIAGFDSQRAAAAQAVFRLGESYRRMGRVDEARVQFARILREFVDFPELASLSQQQLAQALPRRQPGSVYGPPPVFFGGSEAGGSMPADVTAAGSASASPQTARPPADVVVAIAREEERALLEEEIRLLEEALSDVRTQFMSGVAPRSDVLSVQREILQLKRQLLHYGPRPVPMPVPTSDSPAKDPDPFAPEPVPSIRAR